MNLGILTVLSILQLGFNKNPPDSDIEIQYRWEGNKSLCLSITNTGSESIYLFDSYLNNEYVNNKYFKRYDSEYIECKLSYLPFINFLDLAKSDRLVIGDDKVVSEFQVVWSLASIGPREKYELCLALDLSSGSDSFYEDFDVLYFSDKETLSSINPQQQFQYFTLELAFYSKDEAKFLKIEEDYSVNESDFLKAELDFEVRSISVAFPN